MTKIWKFRPTSEVWYESRRCHSLLNMVSIFSCGNSVFKKQGPANLSSSTRCFTGPFIQKCTFFQSTFLRGNRSTNLIYPLRDHLIGDFRRASCWSSIPITIFGRNNNSGCQSLAKTDVVSNKMQFLISNHWYYRTSPTSGQYRCVLQHLAPHCRGMRCLFNKLLR